MNIKKIIMLGSVMAAGVALFAADPVVSNVTAKQRYLWNGMVDVSSEITSNTVGEDVVRG